MKSLKSLRKGASKRAVMKNQDGSPIHYNQQDQAPVFEAAGRVGHDNLNSWRHHANQIGAYIEDHGTHHEAHHKAGGLLGVFHSHPDGEGRGHGYIDHPVGKYPTRFNEAVETLDQLYLIFEEAGLFEAAPAAAAHAAGQHASHHHEELLHHAKEMAGHLRAQKSQPHNLTHQAKISDQMDKITKKHGHEAAHYTHIAAQAFARGNETTGHATVKGAHRHSLAHHGLIPESLTPARAKEAIAKADYQAVLAQTAKKAGVKTSEQKHERNFNRYQHLLKKVGEALETSPAGLKKWRKANQTPGNVETGASDAEKSVEAQTAADNARLHGIKEAKVRRPTDAEYSKAKAFASSKGAKLASVGVHKVTSKINVELDHGNKPTTHHVVEEVIFEAGKAKSEMKRKYLGKSKGRTKVGTKAHPIDTDPKLVIKDNPMGRVASKMPQPMASKGI